MNTLAMDKVELCYTEYAGASTCYVLCEAFS